MSATHATKTKEKKMSGLDAAAKVLTNARHPLGVKEIYEGIKKNHLWHTNGKTPEATLYAAIIREISKKGRESRFKKTERGRFAIA